MIQFLTVVFYLLPIIYAFILASIILEHDKDNGVRRINRKVLYLFPILLIPCINYVITIYWLYLANKLDKEEDERYQTSRR